MYFAAAELLQSWDKTNIANAMLSKSAFSACYQATQFRQMLFCLQYFIVGICYITDYLQEIWDVSKFSVKQQNTELTISRIYKTFKSIQRHIKPTWLYISYTVNRLIPMIPYILKKNPSIYLSFYLVMLLIHSYYTIRGWGLINNGFSINLMVQKTTSPFK